MKPSFLLRTDTGLLNDEAIPDKLYVNLFGKLPSSINGNKSIQYSLKDYIIIVENLGFKLINTISNIRYYNHKKFSPGIHTFQYKNYILLVQQQNYECADKETFIVRLLYDINDCDKKFIDKIVSFWKEHEEKYEFMPEIGIISTSSNELNITYVPYSKMDVNLENNYNNDFYKISDNILKDLQEEKHGLHILHGTPGTGKTTVIKHFISTLSKKKFIFIPARMVSSLSDPALISLLVKRGKDTVLVIEDAEEALVSEGGTRNSAINTLLNMADGFLGSILNIQIIATFNTDFKNVDEAILRKGRLLNIYEFKKLSVEKSNNLLKSLNSDYITTEPMSLADIYNINKELLIEEKSENKITL